MKDSIFKASILVEALPYIKEFSGQIVVIKYGGSAMEDENLKEKVLTDIALMKYVGIRPVIVHGGGKEITGLAKKLGKDSVFLDGFRVTDKEMMNATEMVLSGSVNKDIVSRLNQNGIRAVGISGRDAKLVKAVQKSEKYGFVGEVTDVDAQLIYDLEDSGYVPVVSPVAEDEKGNAFNVNADIVASEIARKLKAKKLVLLTDVDGIFRDIKKPETLISSLNVKEAIRLIEEKIIVSGMLPKIRSCMDAILGGVEKIHIINGTLPHALLLEIFTKAGIGTQIVRD